MADGWERAQEQPNMREPWLSYKSYAVVRNPYARMVSYWSYWRDIQVEKRPFEDFKLRRKKKPDHASLVKWYDGCRIDQYLRFEMLDDQFSQFFKKT